MVMVACELTVTPKDRAVFLYKQVAGSQGESKNTFRKYTVTF